VATLSRSSPCQPLRRRQWSKGDGDQRAEHARPGEHVEGGLEAVAAGGQGAFMGSRGPPPIGHARRTTNARLMEMRGRRMNGWLRVDPEHVRPQRQLAEWVELGARRTRARCWQSGRPSKFAQCAVQCREAERGRGVGGGVGSGGAAAASSHGPYCPFARTPKAPANRGRVMVLLRARSFALVSRYGA
jgi:hypothetical protein